MRDLDPINMGTERYVRRIFGPLIPYNKTEALGVNHQHSLLLPEILAAQDFFVFTMIPRCLCYHHTRVKENQSQR